MTLFQVPMIPFQVLSCGAGAAWSSKRGVQGIEFLRCWRSPRPWAMQGPTSSRGRGQTASSCEGLSSAKAHTKGCQKFLLFIFPSLALWAGSQCHPHVSYYSSRLPSKHQPHRPFDVWAEPASAWGRHNLLRIKRGTQLEMVPRPFPPHVFSRIPIQLKLWVPD